MILIATSYRSLYRKNTREKTQSQLNLLVDFTKPQRNRQMDQKVGVVSLLHRNLIPVMMISSLLRTDQNQNFMTRLLFVNMFGVIQLHQFFRKFLSIYERKMITLRLLLSQPVPTNKENRVKILVGVILLVQ